MSISSLKVVEFGRKTVIDLLALAKQIIVFHTELNKHMSFNRNSHPERHEDEVFITNSDNGTPGEDGGFHKIGWKTKRKGTIAYDIHGEPLGRRWEGSFPVFVKQDEIRKTEGGEEILKRLLPD